MPSQAPSISRSAGEPLDLDRDLRPAEGLRRDEEALLLLGGTGQGRDLGAVLDVAAGAGDGVGAVIADHGGGLGAQCTEMVEGEHEHRLTHERAVPVPVCVEGEPGAGADGAPLGEAPTGDVLAADQPPLRPDTERQRPLLGADAAAQPPLEAQRVAHARFGLGAIPGEDVRGVLVLGDRPTDQRGVPGQVRIGERSQREIAGAHDEAERREQVGEVRRRRHRPRIGMSQRLRERVPAPRGPTLGP